MAGDMTRKSLFTIGFTQKTAEEFFELIKSHDIEIVADVRFNNNSQLAGFTRKRDLPYFLEKICNCEYSNCPELAPSSEILKPYKKKLITWEEYSQKDITLMETRNAAKFFHERFKLRNSVCLLCAEPTPEKCHRRLLAEIIAREYQGTEIIHL